MTERAGTSQQSTVGHVDSTDEQGRKRTESTADGTRHTKKLSLNFPMLAPPHLNEDSRHSRSPDNSTPIDSIKSSPRLIASSSPLIESPDFLTLLASQERKVLELREELLRAENELCVLKSQWASFEASKKKSEIRQIAKLQPLTAGQNGRDDSEGELSAREKRMIIQGSAKKATRKPQQRLFSGSKHTRALSLLSPTSDDRPMLRHSLDGMVSASLQNIETESSGPSIERTNTTPKIETSPTLGKTYKSLANRRSLPPPSTDALMKQGKQMASDLREGLWTFFEDIRQATVGDDDVQNVRSVASGRMKPGKERSQTALLRKKNQHFGELGRKERENKDQHARDGLKDASFWREFGVETPHKTEAVDKPSLDSLMDMDDDWAWESPAPKQSPTPKKIPQISTPHQANSALPWPELTKLTPSKLTQTMSDLMRDWESPGSANTSGGAREENGERRGEQEREQEREQEQNRQHHALASPHI